MDKYEYNLKLDQLKQLVAEEDYGTAAEIAGTINWKKVRNSNTLCMVAKIFEVSGQYEACRDALLQAYDHSSIGKNILYQLTEVAIRAKRIDEADEYFHEFMNVAAKDNRRYILAYKIGCLKEAPISDRIAILEEFKEKEYTESWAYELAVLYSQAGMRDKCVDICDEMVLWFGEGEYVEKALDLKRRFQPLTPSQEKKYQKFREKKGIVEINLPKKTEMKISEETGLPEVTITASKFNTVNLQEEIAKGMAQIEQATEKETVSNAMDSIKKLVSDIPYLNTEESTGNTQTFDREMINAAVDEDLKADFQVRMDQTQRLPNASKRREKKNLQPLEAAQMSIEDVLAEWEMTKRAAEEAIAVAEQKKLEMAKDQALIEAGEIMERLKMLIPILSADPDEIPEPEATVAEEIASDDIPFEDAEPEMHSLSQYEESELEAMKEGEPEAEEPAEDPIEDLDDPILPEQTEASEEAPEAEVEPQIVEPQDVAEEDVLAEAEPEELPVVEEEPVIAEETPDAAWEEPEAEDASDETREEQEKEPQTAPEEPLSRFQKLSQAIANTMELPDVKLFRKVEGEPEETQGKDSWFAEEEEGSTSMTPEQRKIFSYFMNVPGMEEQLAKILNDSKRYNSNNVTSLAGNIIIQGEEGSGKTVLATSLIKAIQNSTGRTNAKIGKISADSLNRKDFAGLIPRLEGGFLIVEKAGNLEPKTIARMSQVMEQNTQGLVVVLEDDSAGIKRVMAQDFAFSKKFTGKVKIPIFTIDELVIFAKAYAMEMECVIDEMGILALYNRINNIQKMERATTLTEVKDIMDHAIESAETGGFKKLFSKRYDDNDFLILREKDFEN